MIRVVACWLILTGTAFAAEPADPIRAALAAGRYGEVEGFAKKVTGKRRLEAVAGWGEALRLTGRYAEARKLLEGVANEPEAHHARVELGQIYRLTGETQLVLADALSLRWTPVIHAARA